MLLAGILSHFFSYIFLMLETPFPLLFTFLIASIAAMDFYDIQYTQPVHFHASKTVFQEGLALNYARFRRLLVLIIL